MAYWISKVNDKQPKLFLADCSNTHLDEQTIRSLRKKSIVVVAVVPKGCTMYIQALDVFVFSVFKTHYYECTEEYIEKGDGRSKNQTYCFTIPNFMYTSYFSCMETNG
jgi:hypothetical protein